MRGFTSLDIKYKPRSLPLIALDAPHIASESGYMKFIYQTRWDFKIKYTLHTIPTARDEASYTRRIVPYPDAKMTSTTDNITSFQFNAVPRHH
jgi:hypothetical protein